MADPIDSEKYTLKFIETIHTQIVLQNCIARERERETAKKKITTPQSIKKYKVLFK